MTDQGRLKAAVLGASGYVGGELLRLLSMHPRYEIGSLFGDSSAGTHLGAHHRQLGHLADKILQTYSPELLEGHGAIFLALPHGHSTKIAAEVAPDVLVVDCGADFRLKSEDAWNRFYEGPHAGTWPYGLPELPGFREQLKDAKRIAVPGCYPTAASLAMSPALNAGLVEPDVVVVAASGTSGAGRALKSELLGSEVMGSMSAYGIGGVHRHTPEITQNLELVANEKVNVSFSPMLAPMPRGILATCSAPARDGVTNDEVRNAYSKAYDSEPFVDLLPEGDWPTTAAVQGSNMVHLQVAFDEHSNRVIAISAIDNLTKGTAGAAIQSANIAFGWNEQEGLPTIGVTP